MISLMAYAGLRPAEVRSLRWEDVRVATLVVRSADGTEGEEKTTKTGGIRAVPILAPLAEEPLAALDRVGPLVVDDVSIGTTGRLGCGGRRATQQVQRSSRMRCDTRTRAC